MLLKKTLLLLSVLLAGYTGYCQGLSENTGDDPYDEQTYFMYGAGYLSNNVYLGRKDSAALPYIGPYLGYHHKSGFYAKAHASYLPKKKVGRFDMFTAEAGYEHSYTDHIVAGASAEKYFFNANTTSIRGKTSASTGIWGQYSNSWIQPQLSFDANFNKKSTDFVTGLQLDHDFVLSDGKMHIAPTVCMYAGTQHYYEEYLVAGLLKKDKSLKLKKVLANAGGFVPLDYEISTKITWRPGKWLFTVTPLYAIPVSPSVITLPVIGTLTEKISNTFYISVDICHR